MNEKDINITKFMNKHMPSVKYVITPTPVFTHDIKIIADALFVTRTSHKSTHTVLFRNGEKFDDSKRYEIHRIWSMSMNFVKSEFGLGTKSSHTKILFTEIL